MNLIENYLSETGRHLPDDSRHDILDELRVSLEEQVTERAAGKGRQANLEDEKSVLIPLGHPVKLAASFKPAQYLIGPEIFPAYVYSLKIGLVIALSIQLIIALALSPGFDWSLAIGSAIGQLIDTGFMVVTIITLVFVLLEYSSEKLNWYNDWTPEVLAKSASHGPTYTADTGDMMFNVVVEGFFLLWWNNLLTFVSHSESQHVMLSNIWEPLFWPVNVVLGVSFALHAYLIVRGYWTSMLLRTEIFLGASGVAMCVYLLIRRPLVTIENVQAQGNWAWVEHLAASILVVMILVWLWDLAKYARLLTRV